MEAVTHSVREGLPWEMLYADDLVLVGKCEEELKEKLRKWNECLKDKGLKINEEKIKVMCESFGTGTTQVIGNLKGICREDAWNRSRWRRMLWVGHRRG